ncbi:hypothetical protein [Odoribacter lunatus]|uniref:hypothetical protein n=1 Tax=Odoribacter lunatus TaxID=2941335 RepID=UPI00203C55E5|nr:hypothetical protein [Odoribacter lunatus]
MRGFIFGILLFWWGGAGGQNAVQDSMAVCMQKITEVSGDSLRLAYSDRLAEWIGKLGVGEYDATQGIKYLGYKPCRNAKAELFSWSIPLSKGAAYYNYFLFEDKKKSVLLKSLPGDETGVPPYLFYDFWAFDSNKREYFVLLGWGETTKINRKAILIAEFTPSGKVNFNRRLLKRGNSRSAAMSFEYGKGMSMMLKQDKNGKRIIFDHLSPGEEKYEGAWMFYGPDGTVNAFELKKGEWQWKEKLKDRELVN